MSIEEYNKLKITSITVTWNVEDIWKLSFEGVSSAAFILSDHIFHLYMRRYELSIAVYLCRDDVDPVVMPLLVKLCMVDHVGQEKLIGEREIVVEKEKEFVLLESVMIGELETLKDEFLSKDVLTVNCTLSSSYRVNLMTKQESVAKHTINRLEMLSSDLENCYNTQENTDALLRVENTEFPVHRTIITARCPELGRQIGNNPPDDPVQITNISASTMRDVLYYIYTGKIRSLHSGNCVQMFAAANRFSLNEVKNVCLNLFRSSLTEDNVFQAAAVAHECGDLVLKEEIEQYLTQNISAILQSAKWKEFCGERYKFANEILTAVLMRMQPTSSSDKEHN